MAVLQTMGVVYLCFKHRKEKNQAVYYLYHHFSPIMLLSTSSQLSPVGVEKYNKWTSVWTQKQLVENLHAAFPWLQSVSRHFTFPRETVCRRLGFLVYLLFQATWWKKHNIIAWHHRCVACTFRMWVSLGPHTCRYKQHSVYLKTLSLFIPTAK